MASAPQVHQAAQGLAMSLVKEEVGKSRPAPIRQIRQRRNPSPLTQLKAMVTADALLKQQGSMTPATVNPFTAAPTQTKEGLLSLISQKGAPPSPNGFV